MSPLWDGKDIAQLGRPAIPTPANDDIDGPLAYRDASWAMRRLNVSIGNDLRWHRRRLGLGEVQGAREIGIHPRTLAGIERGGITLPDGIKFLTVWIIADWLARVEHEDR